MRHDLIKRTIPRIRLLSVIGITLFCYFSWHLVQGERSYVRLIGLNNKLEQVRGEYENVHDKRVALEKRVRMLRPGSMNADLLKERVRKQLGYRQSGERDLLLSDIDKATGAS